MFSPRVTRVQADTLLIEVPQEALTAASSNPVCLHGMHTGAHALEDEIYLINGRAMQRLRMLETLLPDLEAKLLAAPAKTEGEPYKQFF